MSAINGKEGFFSESSAANFPIIPHSSSASAETQKVSSECKRKRENPAPLFFIRELHNPQRNPYIVFVGDDELKSLLHEQFDQIGLLYQIVSDGLFWSRDGRVVLLDAAQTHLISSPFIQDLHEPLFFNLLPSDMIHFRCAAYSGQGVMEQTQEEARKIARFYQAPSKDIPTCLEGGNCLLFKGPDGKPRAIIGYSSIILSLISLLHKNYFSKASPIKRAKHDLRFSSDELRVAKDFYSFFKKNVHVVNEPIPENSEQVQKWARKIAKMIEMTKLQIADDLQIPISQIAFVSQGDFHIDMEMFPGPDGIVFIHDEKQMLEIQESIGEKNMPFLIRTKCASKSRLDAASKRLEKNIEILQKIGCKPVLVPGVLRVDLRKGEKVDYNYLKSHWMEPNCLPFSLAEGDICSHAEEHYEIDCDQSSYLINFMNGLLLQNAEGKNYFFTAGIPNHPNISRFKEAFLIKVHQVCPDIEVVFLEGCLQDILLRHLGSIHCLTSTSA